LIALRFILVSVLRLARLGFYRAIGRVGFLEVPIN
jgi:hypothetical protein